MSPVDGGGGVGVGEARGGGYHYTYILGAETGSSGEVFQGSSSVLLHQDRVP